MRGIRGLLFALHGFTPLWTLNMRPLTLLNHIPMWLPMSIVTRFYDEKCSKEKGEVAGF